MTMSETRSIAERVAKLKALTELSEEIHQVRDDIAGVIQSVSAKDADA
jgi:Asp-tRNA(Asn)/Glu-tRNA(Gln) amidotransferase C subunit